MRGELVDGLLRVLDSSVADGGCWIWEGTVDSRSGLPVARLEGRQRSVKVWVVEVRDNLTFAGSEVTSTSACGRRLCVSPACVRAVRREWQ